MGGYQIPGQGPNDDGFDEDGYDESQRAEILEVEGGGPGDGTILTDLAPDLGEETEGLDDDGLKMVDDEIGEEDDELDQEEEDLEEDEIQEDFDNDALDEEDLDEELDDADEDALEP